MRPHRPLWGNAYAPRGPPAAIAPKGLKTSHLRPLGGGNFCPADASHGFSRPASECRAGRGIAGVCQGGMGHCVGRLNEFMYLDEIMAAKLLKFLEPCEFLHIFLAIGCKDTQKSAKSLAFFSYLCSPERFNFLK